MITTVLTGGANVEDIQTDKHIPYEQNELQQTLEKYDLKGFKL